MTVSDQTAVTTEVRGPFFDELSVGERVIDAPAVTLTDGLASVHQAILGDRLALALDHRLAASVAGAKAPLAHPGLVWDVAIGQTTAITQRVVANLFYRGLVFRRLPLIGDTLVTSTEVVALRQNRLRPGRAATGMAVLRMRTTDQEERPVLDFWRCAMLPLSDPEGSTTHADDVDAIPSELELEPAKAAVAGWDLGAFRAARPGVAVADLRPGMTWRVSSGDVVSSAPELARLSLNVARVHHDHGGTGERLVYGGHTIGLAAAQLSRALPNLVTILAWHGCDHTAPVHEHDTLVSEISVEQVDPVGDGAALVHLRSLVCARRPEALTKVLDWRLVALVA